MLQNPFSNRGKNIQKNFNHIAYSTLTLCAADFSFAQLAKGKKSRP